MRKNNIMQHKFMCVICVCANGFLHSNSGTLNACHRAAKEKLLDTWGTWSWFWAGKGKRMRWPLCHIEKANGFCICEWRQDHSMNNRLIFLSVGFQMPSTSPFLPLLLSALPKWKTLTYTSCNRYRGPTHNFPLASTQANKAILIGATTVFSS